MKMDLRPPLPPQHCSDVPPPHLVRDLLCRMYLAADAMCLGTEARFTGLVLFHRYVAHYFSSISDSTDGKEGKGRKSNNDQSEEVSHRNDLGVVAAACLFLGCKIEEEPRRIRDAINLCHVLDFEGVREETKGRKRKRSQQTDQDKKKERAGKDVEQNQQRKALSGQKGDTCSGDNNDNIAIDIYESLDPPELDESYWDAKERIVATEQNVLRVLHFDATVSHPHRALLSVLDVLGFWSYVEIPVGDENGKHANSDNDEKRSDEEIKDGADVGKGKRDKNNSKVELLVKGAWRILNDSVFHAPALQKPVLSLACAALCLSAEELTKKDEEISTTDKGSKSTSHQSAQQTHHYNEAVLPSCWWKALGIDDIALDEAKKSLVDASSSLLRSGRPSPLNKFSF